MAPGDALHDSCARPVPPLVVIGVRHHSPACARLVAATLVELRPAHVLIEGPADMNERLDELLLPHQLPVAVFSHHHENGARTSASWTPFCAHSPEWQALMVGSQLGAQVRFMDLPAWHKALWGVSNRYDERAFSRAEAVARLCRRFHLDGFDVLWDHLFEGPAEGAPALAALAQQLETFFVALRGASCPDTRDAAREAFMCSHIRAALASGAGPVVAVCGGFHAPVLARVAEAAPVAPALAASEWGARWPTVAMPPGASSYVVPWSYQRLDSFHGYDAGMPSPAFYDAVFADGPQEAPARLLELVVTQLRSCGWPVAAADVIAATTASHALARLRGHSCWRRTDLLDGLTSALIKEALDEPLPWSEGGKLAATDSMIAEMLRALTGNRAGRLDARTPQPPLLADVEQTLSLHGLEPSQPARTVELKLTRAADLARSRVLHRLRVLGIPGFARQRGPQGIADSELGEVWRLEKHDLLSSMLIEAAAFGATLADAACRKLEEALLGAPLHLAELAALLSEAACIDAGALSQEALARISQCIRVECDLARLGEALPTLLGLCWHNSVFSSLHPTQLGAMVVECHSRGLWLLENIGGGKASGDGRLVRAVRALRDVARLAPRLALVVVAGGDVFRRMLEAHGVAADVRGACLGALWSLGELGEAAAVVAAAAVRRAASAELLGDFVMGLCALAREEMAADRGVLGVIDATLSAFDEQQFLQALPSLRLAFAYFPPRERARMAQLVAQMHGASELLAGELLHLAVDPVLVARGRQLDAEVTAVMRRYGLDHEERR